MKKLSALIIILCFAVSAHAAKKRQLLPYETDDDPPVPLAYTHLLPSTAVIPGGNFVVGTTMGYGFFDLVDVSTNLYLDLAQVFNISSKVHIYGNDDFAVAAFITYESQVAKTLNEATLSTVTQTYSALAPGATVSYYITPKLTGHTGFSYTIHSPTIAAADLQPKDGFVQGTTVNQEFTVGITRAVALSGGLSYDLTYSIFGAGASVHINGLQIGAHYYFNVGVDSFLPILGFGYAF